MQCGQWGKWKTNDTLIVTQLTRKLGFTTRYVLVSDTPTYRGKGEAQKTMRRRSDSWSRSVERERGTTITRRKKQCYVGV